MLNKCGINNVLAGKLKPENQVFLCLSKSLIFFISKGNLGKTHAHRDTHTKTHTLLRFAG